MVLVSHDRHLLRTTVDELWLVAEGGAVPFDGDLDDYAAWLTQRRAAAKPVAAEQVTQREQRVEDRAAKKSALAERRKLEKEAGKLEQQLADWQAAKSVLEAQLADPALYAASDHAQIDSLHRHQSELVAAIETAETRWLDIHASLESAP
jgi:ATP-binding cassette subfamily F protein 3